MGCSTWQAYQAIYHRDRVREGIEAARASGVKFGGLRPRTIIRNADLKAKACADAEELRPVLTALQAQGASLRQMADALAKTGFTTKAGNPFKPTHVKRQLQRLGLCT